MLKNRYGFIPSRYRKPHDYRKIGRDWNAIYLHPVTGQEFAIEMKAHYLFTTDEYASELRIYRQDKDCWRRVGSSYKTIKAAVQALEDVFAEPVENSELGE